MCFSNFSSRYVLFDRTGVLNGFIIFLMATDVLVSWSFAEQTSPNAPIPTGCRSTYLVVTSKTVLFQGGESVSTGKPKLGPSHQTRTRKCLGEQSLQRP